MKTSTLLVAVLCGLLNGSSADTLHDRHEVGFADKHGSLDYTQSQFSHLMESECRPEPDGYFGSTHGEPWVVQYGFEMESPRFADVDAALDVINEHVMDRILATSFPEYCALEKRRVLRHNELHEGIRGFNFAIAERVNHLTCSVQVSETSSCLVFKSRVAIYGDRLHDGMQDEVLDTIRSAVREVVASEAGVIRITIVESLFTTLSVPSSEWWQLSTTTLIGVIVCLLGLLVGCVALVIYIRSDVLARKDETQGLMKPRIRMSDATNSRTADETASHFTETFRIDDDDPSVIIEDDHDSRMPASIYLQEFS